METSECMNVARKYTREWHVEQSKQRATNGFTHAPNIWQTISIFVYVVVCTHYFVMVSYAHNWARRAGLVVAEVVIAVVVFGCWLRVSMIDPADPTHVQHWKSIIQSRQFKKPQHRLMCPICQTYRSPQSFHCKKCNKCIQKFDHHCKWVNNCVGFKNYQQFLILLISLIIFLAYNASVIIYYLIAELTYEDPQAPIKIVSIIICVIDFLGIAVLGSLLVFHIVLICTGKRTISILLAMRGNSKEQSNSHKTDTEKSEDPMNRKFQVVLKPVGVYNVDKEENGEGMEQKRRVRTNLDNLKLKKVSLFKISEAPKVKIADDIKP